MVISRSKAVSLRKQGGKLTKKQAGSLGGQSTVKKHGKTYMHNLAVRGAAAFHQKYRWSPLGTSDFALVVRATNEPTGKTIRGDVFPVRSEGWQP